MARVTVEDCVLKIPNRFELVLIASQRGRDIASGAPITLERDNDKNPVVALREIADDTLNLEQVKNSLIKGMQKHVEVDEPEEDRDLEIETQSWPVDVAPAEDAAAESVDEDEELEEDEDELLALEDEAAPDEGAPVDALGEDAVEGDAEAPKAQR